jgi:hypothetical protein
MVMRDDMPGGSRVDPHGLPKPLDSGSLPKPKQLDFETVRKESVSSPEGQSVPESAEQSKQPDVPPDPTPVEPLVDRAIPNDPADVDVAEGGSNDPEQVDDPQVNGLDGETVESKPVAGDVGGEMVEQDESVTPEPLADVSRPEMADDEAEQVEQVGEQAVAGEPVTEPDSAQMDEAAVQQQPDVQSIAEPDDAVLAEAVPSDPDRGIEPPVTSPVEAETVEQPESEQSEESSELASAEQVEPESVEQPDSTTFDELAIPDVTTVDPQRETVEAGEAADPVFDKIVKSDADDVTFEPVDSPTTVKTEQEQVTKPTPFDEGPEPKFFGPPADVSAAVEDWQSRHTDEPSASANDSQMDQSPVVENEPADEQQQQAGESSEPMATNEQSHDEQDDATVAKGSDEGGLDRMVTDLTALVIEMGMKIDRIQEEGVSVNLT